MIARSRRFPVCNRRFVPFLVALLLSCTGAVAQWQQAPSHSGPVDRWAHCLAFYGGSGGGGGRVVTFGGVEYVAQSLVRQNDLWSWDSAAQIWTQVSTPNAPPVRDSCEMVYDSVRQVLVLHGGNSGDAMSTRLTDTWEWNGTTWTQAATTGPSGRVVFGMAFHAGSARTVLFGGTVSSQTEPTDDTWTWDGTTWTQRSPTHVPPSRAYFDMVYDTARDVVVMAGGANSSRTFARRDTWEWDGSDWREVLATNYPVDGFGWNMTYDQCKQVVVLFNGNGRTWEFDGVDWTDVQRPPPIGPTHFSWMPIEYDPIRKVTVARHKAVPTLEYTAVGVLPTLSSCVPATAPSGTTQPVTIHGTGFRHGTAVDIGGSAATVTQVHADRIDAIAPALAYGTYSITVQVPGANGCPAPPPVTLVDAYAVCTPTPIVTGISPAVGPASNSTTVTLAGSDFLPGCAVLFGTVPATVTSVTAAQLQALAPAQPGMLGAVDVTVTNPGQACTTPTTVVQDGFVYADPPQLNAVSPATGATCGGGLVTLQGDNFHELDGPLSVTFGGLPATVQSYSRTTIDAVVPSHLPGAVDVAVTTSSGTATLTAAYTYQVIPPHFFQAVPATGRAMGGELVTLQGRDFCPNTQVWFGDDPCPSVTFVDEFTLEVVTPLTNHHDGSESFFVDITVRDPNMLGNRVCHAFEFVPGNVLRVGPTRAYTTIQSAIHAAIDGDAILVDRNGALNFPYTENLSIDKQVLLRRADPNGQRPRVNAQNATQPTIVIGSNATRATVIFGLEVQSGRSGIAIGGGEPLVIDCEIHDNTGVEGAGVRIHSGANPRLIGNAIHNNPPPAGSPATRGGGVAIVGAGTTASLIDNFVYGNAAADGGGLFVGSGAAIDEFAGNTFWNNTASAAGGAIHVGTTVGVLLADSVLRQNTAGTGAGVFVEYGGNVTLSGMAVRDNVAGGDGGGVAIGGATLAVSFVQVYDSELQGNRAEGACGRGGAIFLQGQSTPAVVEVYADLARTRFYRNTAQVGGALAMEDKVRAYVTRCEFARNTVALHWNPSSEAICPWQPPTAFVPEVSGPGIYVSDSFLQLLHNTIDSNTGGNAVAQDAGGLYARTTLISGSHIGNNVFSNNVSPALSPNLWLETIERNCYHGNQAAAFALNGNPLYADPLYVGGALPIGLAAPSPFELQSNSPCLDQALPGLSPVPPGGGALPDIGAHEFGSDLVTFDGEPSPNHCALPQIAVDGTPQLGNSPGIVGTGFVPGNVLVALLIGEPFQLTPLQPLGGPAGSNAYVAQLAQPLVPANSFGMASYQGFQVPPSNAFVDLSVGFQFVELDYDLLGNCGGCTVPIAHTRAAVLRVRP